MNWLAHLFLSEPTAAFRIGNVLPDILPLAELRRLPPEFLAGAECHWQIDAFTDSHPVFRRSVARLAPPYRRFGGVLMDLFYDHFLAVDWGTHADVPLEQFTQAVYADIEANWSELPPAARERFHAMRTQDWLCSYREIEGVRVALNRIGSRLRKPQKLGESVAELEHHYEPLRTDFSEFFPLLRAHVGSRTVAR